MLTKIFWSENRIFANRKSLLISEFFKKSQIQMTGEFFKNFDHNSGWKPRLFVNFFHFSIIWSYVTSGEKFEIFISIRILVKNLEDFDQNSGNLMENLKNLDQNSGEKFERFRSESGGQLVRWLWWNSLRIEFLSEVWKSYKNVEEFWSEYCWKIWRILIRILLVN